MCANDRCVQDLLSLAHDLIDLNPAYSGIRKRAEAVLAAHDLPLRRQIVAGDRVVRLTPAMIQSLARLSAESPTMDLILHPDAASREGEMPYSLVAPAEPAQADIEGPNPYRQALDENWSRIKDQAVEHAHLPEDDPEVLIGSGELRMITSIRVRVEELLRCPGKHKAVEQAIYSLRATAQDCEAEGNIDRASLLRTCAATLETR